MAGALDALTPTTIANYARGAWDGLSQQHRFFRNFKERGKIRYNVGGEYMEGPLEAGRYRPIVSAPGMDISGEFVAKVRHKRWRFDWGEIVGALPIDRGLLRRNTGTQALVDLKKTEVRAMLRDMIVGTDGLQHQLLRMDGEAYTGNGLPMFGLPTLLHGPGSTGLVGFDGNATATGIAPADTDKEVTYSSTSGTYGGLSMERSALTGVDNLEADAWTSTLVNLDFDWGGGTETPSGNNLLKALQHLVNRCSRFSSEDSEKRPSEGWLDRILFANLGDAVAAKQTIYVQSNQGSVQTPNLGYAQDHLMHAGLRWNWDAQVPDETAYCLNFDKAELAVQELYKDLQEASPLEVTGEDAGIIEVEIAKDPFRRQYLVSGTIPGQVMFHPRYQGRASRYS